MTKEGDMLDRLKRITNSKSFHIVVIIVIITIILFTAGLIILKYNVEGETNMPFDLTKISVISTSEGIDKEAGENKWAFDVNQNNDIYLYIDKNKNYSKTEAIKSISIENINVESKINEKIKIYKPAVQVENSTFKNTQENEITNLEYLGDMQSDLKNLKISNQGGLLAFRCAINNVAEYKSNDEEINHYELLKKAGVKNEDLQTKITFDLLIKVQEGKEYKTTINLDLPVDDVVEKGTTSIEITDLSKFIFKRL